MTGENKNWFRRLIEADPVLVRGFIVAAFGLTGTVLNKAFAEGTVEAAVTGVISVLALVAAIWSRPKVTPNSKVVTFMPSPDKHPGVILPGPANDSVVSSHSVQANMPARGDMRDIR